MRIAAFVVILGIIQTGCSSSFDVSSSPNADPSYTSFNVDAYGRSGMVLFRSGRKLGARNIVASPDSTRFVNDRTDAMAVVPTQSIEKVVFRNRWTGFLEGFGLGALAGASTVLALRGADHTVLFTAIGAGAGGLIVGILGMISGHSYEYSFMSSADSLKR
jgi:hypothetical protein